MDSSTRPVSNDTIQTIDRFVTHVSTVPANLGQTVGLHLREKVSSVAAASAKPHVVLFVHGGFSPSNVAYDLDYEDDYILWQALMKEDGLGAHWTADGRGIMRAPIRMNFGWRANIGSIKAPTLCLLGEFDNYDTRFRTWGGLTTDNRVKYLMGDSMEIGILADMR